MACEQASRRKELMKFIADCMVGKLARWLRVLGFNVSYYPKIEDTKLVELARRENRVILTRDHELIRKAKNLKSLLIESDRWENQVEQVLDHFELWKKIDPHSRCIECNAKLKILPKEKAKNLVPLFVYEQAEVFALCPSCGRIFWKGTHFRDMEKKLSRFVQKSKKLE